MDRKAFFTRMYETADGPPQGVDAIQIWRAPDGWRCKFPSSLPEAARAALDELLKTLRSA